MKRILKILPILIFAVLLCSCSSFNITEGISLIESLSKSEGIFGFKPSHVKIKEIEFLVDEDANNKSVTSVDLLIVYKDGPISKILQTSATDYFANKDEFVRQNEGLIEIHDFELVPSYNIKQNIRISKKRPIAAFLFIYYWDSNNINRFRVGESKKYIVKLHKGQAELIDANAR